jgi:hypothetical protein
MSDVEIDFSDDNLSIDMGSDLGEDTFRLKSKKKKKKSKGKPILKQSTFTNNSAKLPPHDNSFQMFSNPQKRNPASETVVDNNSDNEEYDSQEDFNENDDEYNEGEEYDNYQSDEPQPSSGYATIEDEKQDLLYKFYRLENKGVKLSKKFNMHSDIVDMRSEYRKIVKDAEVSSSLKFSKRMLLAVVSGTEFLNKRYDPLGIELNGWSESVMENMNDGDYDNVFERLHDKYAGKVNTPPELELMLSLAGSAIMFHMTSTMFKQLPNMNDISKQNPEMMQNLMKSMSNMMNQNNGNQQQGQQQQDIPSTSNGRREMKGPSMNIGSLFPGMGPPPPMPTNTAFEVPESVLSDSVSESGSEGFRTVSYTEGGTAKRRGRKTNIISDSTNTIDI